MGSVWRPSIGIPRLGEDGVQLALTIFEPTGASDDDVTDGSRRRGYTCRKPFTVTAIQTCITGFHELYAETALDVLIEAPDHPQVTMS